MTIAGRFAEWVLGLFIEGKYMRRKSRLVLAAVAVLAVVTLPASTTAFAQTWQEYRSDELGFKVEMPGTPQVEEEEDEETVDNNTQKIKWTTVQLDHEEASLGVSSAQFEKGFRQRPIDAYVDDLLKRTEKALGVKVTRQNRLTMNDKPVREFFVETDGFCLVARLVFLDDRIIQVIATSIMPLAANPIVERFLQSFALLPEKR
jgi:hypothetical protein